jgi:hypothetical protein
LERMFVGREVLDQPVAADVGVIPADRVSQQKEPVPRAFRQPPGTTIRPALGDIDRTGPRGRRVGESASRIGQANVLRRPSAGARMEGWF